MKGTWGKMRQGAWAVAIAALLSGCGSHAKALPQNVHVIDGDTLSVDEVVYRLHGIDSPEAGQRCQEPNGGTWRCGEAATKVLEELLEGGSVSCDDRGKDDYDRTLSVCLTNGVNVNSELVARGLAWAFRRFSADFVGDEETARAGHLGIWQADTQTAEDYRAERWLVSAQIAPDGCPIKGNISENGRIYHAPWSPWYDRTKVSVEKGERWFCDEREALDAGWRAPIWGR